MCTKPIKLLGICFTISVAAIIFLVVISRKSDHNNGFRRFFPAKLISSPAIKDISYNSYYIAGLTGSVLYLANTVAPAYICEFNYSLTDSAHIIIKVPKTKNIDWSAVRVLVDSPKIFLTDGVNSSVMTASFRNTDADYLHIAVSNFSKCIPLPDSSYLLRTYSDSLKQNVILHKKKLYRISKQQDGIFSTDGMLLYNTIKHQIIYLFYYSNQIIALDSNLKLSWQNKTIDTAGKAQISIAAVAGGNIQMMSSPPRFVNKKSCVSEKYLFVNSALRADDEDKNTFDENSVIDIYNLFDGSYKCSFYLPQYYGQRLSDFAVHKNKIVALFGNYLLTYKLNL